MSKKQRTLFETWNKNSASDRSPHNSSVTSRNVCGTPHLPTLNASGSSPFQSPHCSKKDELVDPEFDYEAGKTWIYPTNYPVRDYQFSIVQEALFKNTLVVLPTGLGKTFIAAVVMYNIYRWFPNGKVIFMAPTKPLVAQQVDACFNITGIPLDETTQMTGTNSPELRKRLWSRKRVFFLTPQVLVNDLVRNICPASTIKCLVVDEAHKALGNHAYCQVIKELFPYASKFRVLALTATPGSDTQAVKQVLSNLLISHVELRSEDSADVQQYSHIRDIEKIVVPLGNRLTNLKNKYLDVINVYLKRLTMRNVMTTKNPSSLSKFQVLKLREAFSQNPPGNIDRNTYGLAMADFSLLISLYHAYELLLLHGARTFYNFLSGVLNGDKSIPHARTELLKNFLFGEIMESVKENYISEPPNQNTNHMNGQIQKRKVLPGHPKLDKLLEVVLQHFRKAEAENMNDTRVMIFTQYRDSVQEIVDILNEYKPTVKVMNFIGQSSKSASSVGYSQKQQLKVIQAFRSGGYNTLVSTCVGEEGLDIGEVDLIVCYDCPKSPIRSVQRMGRTGRLRKGRIVMLISEGKEEQMYNMCEYRKKTVHKAISNGFIFSHCNETRPSLTPTGIKPICVRSDITIPRKKLEPKAKVVSKSPFLNDEEMMEFNQHVQVPLCEDPLLPKREFIVLKNQKAVAEASISSPRLSLSEWTLWQTTPHQTDMIPHSSKSLLLVKTLEHIHFPELLSSKKPLSVLDFTNPLNRSSDYSICDHFNSLSKRTKNTKLVSALNAVKNDDEIEIISSPEKEVFKEDNQVRFEDSSKNLPLVEQLFNLKLINDSRTNVASDLKSPPKIIKTLKIEDFFHLDLKEIFGTESKGFSILRVLNNKIKAKLKRRLRSDFSKKNKSSASFKISVSPLKIMNLSESNQPCFDASVTSEFEQQRDHDFEAVMFDVDFDIPDVLETDLLASPDKIVSLNDSPSTVCPSEQMLRSDGKNVDSLSFELDFHGSAKYVKHDNFPDVSINKSNLKKCLNLEANNEKESLQMTVPYHSEHSTKYLNNQSTNYLSCSSKENKPASQEGEKMFDSVNFDIDFDDIKEDWFPKHSEEIDVLKTLSRANDGTNISDFEGSRKSDNKANFPNLATSSTIDNDLKECQDNITNISSSTMEGKQLSVLKDLKNTCHVTSKQRSSYPKDASSFKKYSAVANMKNNSDHEAVSKAYTFPLSISGDQISLSSKHENTDDMMQPQLPAKSKISELHRMDNADDFENMHASFNKTKTPLKDQHSKNIDDVSCDLNMSSNNCKKNKLSLKSKNKSFSKNINDSFTKSKVTNLFALPDSKIEQINNETSQKDSVECNFDFDVSFGNETMKLESNFSPCKHAISSESTKVYSFTKNVNISDDLDEFDKNAHSILEQLFTSQNNSSLDLNSSFSSPLTIKHCISERDENSKSKRQKELQTTPSNLCNQPGNSAEKYKFEKLDDTTEFKTPFRKNILNVSKIASRNNLNQTATNLSAEASQCTLTQLLSLIDTTESSRKGSRENLSNKSINHKDPEVDIASSEDEICPTPPKEISKSKSEFIYYKKSTVHRSLDFKNCNLSPRLQKCNENTQKFNPACFELKSSNRLEKSEGQEKFKKNVDFDNCVSKGNATIASFNNSIQDPILLLDNETAEKEPSPKISFDVSFDLPFTQEDFENSANDEVLDMNMALIIEGSSSEKKQILSQNNTNSSLKFQINEDEKINGMPEENLLNPISSKSTVYQKYSDSENLFLCDNTEAEDSESLLSSKPIINKESILEDENISDKNVALNKSSCNIKISNSKLLNDQMTNEQNIKGNSYETHENIDGEFANGTSFSLLSTASNTCTNIPVSKSVSSIEIKSDIELKRSSTVSNKRSRNVGKFKENIPDLNAFSNADCSNSCFESKFNEKSKIQIYSEFDSTEKHFQNLPSDKLISDKMKIQNMSTSSINHEPIDLSEDFPEDQFCFDLNFVDEETCDLLPCKISLDSSEKISGLQKCNSVEKSARNSLQVCTSIDSAKFPKENVLKDIHKQSVLKNTEVCDDKAAGQLNDDSGELKQVYHLDDEDQSFMVELNENNHFKANKITNQTIFNIINTNNSSDEFDLYNLDKNSNLKKSFDCSSKLAFEKQLKSCDAECSRESPSAVDSKRYQSNVLKINEGCSKQKCPNDVDSKSNQSNVLKSKLSSKLSTKFKTKAKNDIENNQSIEDEDGDFQFVRKAKKNDKPSKSASRKRKKLSNRNEFLLSQVEVSGSDNSDHESLYGNGEGDMLEESFIDDESPSKFEDTDQHAFYLKSLRNHVGLPQKFKLKQMQNDRFLREPDAEYSHYEFDSFCVNDEDVVYLSSEDNLEESPVLRHKKQPNKYRKEKNPRKRLRRVITHDSSSEHEISPKVRKCNPSTSAVNNDLINQHDDSIIPVRKPKQKLVIISSDEEDELIFFKPLSNETDKCIENPKINSVNVPTPSSKSTEDSILTEKCEFNVDFDDDNYDVVIPAINTSSKNLYPVTSKKASNLTAICEKDSTICIPSSNNPSMSKPMQCDSNFKHVQTIENDQIEDISFDLGWDEICQPVSNINEVQATISSNEVTLASISMVPDKNDAVPVILVDSRELASGKPVISALRNRHNINPSVMPLSCADYIISNRIAVERVLDSEFSSVPMPPKIVEKITEMSGIFEKLVVIIEKDSRKHIMSFNKNVTKYLQFVININVYPCIEVLFAKSTDHTSDLIASLVQREKRRGFHINVPVALNARNQKLFNFYCTFPKISPVCALNFMYQFPTVESLFKSSVEDLKKKGCISSHKAVSLYKFLRSELTFHEKM